MLIFETATVPNMIKIFYWNHFKRGLTIFLFLLPFYAALAEGKKTSFLPLQKETSPIYKIGVLAYRGKQEAIKQWAAHATYLNQQLAPITFEIIPLSYQDNELTQAVINQQLDFVITDSGHYFELKLGGHISRLATRRVASKKGALDQFGGTAIVRAGQNSINTYADLVGKTILTPSQSSLGGWQSHLREALSQKVDLRLQSTIIEVKNHITVITLLLSGAGDVGFVRSDLLEAMVSSNLINFKHLKILNVKKIDHYPYLLSTRLYSEWPFSTVKGTPKNISTRVLQALLALSNNNIAAKEAGIYGWTIPSHYNEIKALFNETGLGPYKPQIITTRSIILQYRLELILLALFFLILFFSIFRIIKTNKSLQQEIIGRKKTELVLEENKSKLALVIESTGAGIWDWHMLDNKLIFDNRWAEILGYTLDELAPITLETWQSLTHPNDYLYAKKLLSQYLNKEITFYRSAVRMRHKKGHWIWVLDTGRIIECKETDEPIGMIGTHLDITETKLAEKSLQKTKNNLNKVQEISHLGSWELDLINQTLNWSDELYRIFEVDPKHFKPTYQLFIKTVHPEDRTFVQQSLAMSVDNAVYYNIDYRLLMSNGRIKYINERCETSFNKENNPLLSVGSILDISDSKLINDELKQRIDELDRAKKATLNMIKDVESARHAAEQANHAKSEFLANMSHEIRTPLNAVTGINYLLRQTKLSNKQAEYIDTIHRSMLHVTGIINDLLDFSKIEAGKLKLEEIPFNLDQVFDNLTDLLMQNAEYKNVELLYDIPLSIPRALLGDPTRLGQILINLVGNAIKFSGHGEVLVRVFIEKNDNNRITLCFSIKDNGIGIKKSQIPTLFRAFEQADNSTTRKYGGSGLGLAICQYLVQAMSGKIRVESKIGIGSEFQFSVKLRLQPTKETNAFIIPSHLQHLHVLIVDNNASSREILTTTLKCLSLDYTAVSSEKEAISQLKYAYASLDIKNIDLILMDGSIPETSGTNPADYINQQLGILPSPIIVLSAHKKESMSRHMNPVDLQYFLQKPINASILYKKIMQIIGKKIPNIQENNLTIKKTKAVSINAHGKCILIVEDQIINSQIVTEILIYNGFIVEAVVNGQLAVARIKQKPMLFDAVLMDIQMPVMDGYEATRLIRQFKTKQALPIIAMTAHALDVERKKCQQAGMNAHISKPVDVEIMLSTLIELLNIPNAIQPPSISKPSKIPDNLPGINLQEGINRVMGNTTLYINLLQNFPIEYKNTIKIIRKHITEGNIDAARKIVHKLIGCAGNLSMTSLYLVVHKLQIAVKSNDDCDIILNEVEQAHSQVMHSIEQLKSLNAHTTPSLALSDKKDTNLTEIKSLTEELSKLLTSNDLLANKKIEQLLNLSGNSNEITTLKAIEKQIIQLNYSQALQSLEQLTVK